MRQIRRRHTAEKLVTTPTGAREHGGRRCEDGLLPQRLPLAYEPPARPATPRSAATGAATTAAASATSASSAASGGPGSMQEQRGRGGSDSTGSRTVVEQLRDRLERLSFSQRRASASVAIDGNGGATAATGAWLPGTPCVLDASRCAHSHRIGDLELQLPFAPLPPQVEVADRVVQACQTGGVAVLESPTGTGKSIALLSAALAWQRSCYESRGAAAQIIYCVRTHAQLGQMVRELRKMPYRPRMSVIGSREQLCINDEVKALAELQRLSLNLTCRQAARNAVSPVSDAGSSNRFGSNGQVTCSCAPYARLGNVAHANRVFQHCGNGQVWDVEDLVNVCKSTSSGGCPYYTSHVLAGDAEIVFCPHNYVLDPAISQCRSHHRERWSLEGRVIIIDEAHNIEQGCRDAGSVEVSLREVRDISSSLEALALRRPTLRLRPRGAREHGCADACKELLRLPSQIATILTSELASGDAGAGVSESIPSGTAEPQSQRVAGLSHVWGLPGHMQTSDFVRRAGLAEHALKSRASEELCVELTDKLLRLQASGEASAEDSALLGVLGRLQELITKLQLTVKNASSYVVGIAKDASVGGTRSSENPSLAVWLMSPGVIFDTFAARAHATILASGTLAPLPALTCELAASKAYAERAQPQGPLEAGHVVGRGQVLAAVLPCFASSGRPTIGTYDSWRSATYLADLGDAVARLAETMPGGILCFFPSYASLEACRSAWTTAAPTIWERLQRAKGAVVLEPRGSSRDFADVCTRYSRAVTAGRGALALAVYRGKLSEGLSFDGDQCRGVICVGVPFPQCADPVVVAKRCWNDAQRQRAAAGDGASSVSPAAVTAPGAQRNRWLSGGEWYELQAYRAVSQALGRCIRHRGDYGALVLLDARWARQGERSRGLRRHLARWLQPFLEEHPARDGWKLFGARLRSFFAEAPGHAAATAASAAASAAAAAAAAAASSAPSTTLLGRGDSSFSAASGGVGASTTTLQHLPPGRLQAPAPSLSRRALLQGGARAFSVAVLDGVDLDFAFGKSPLRGSPLRGGSLTSPLGGGTPRLLRRSSSAESLPGCQTPRLLRRSSSLESLLLPPPATSSSSDAGLPSRSFAQAPAPEPAAAPAASRVALAPQAAAQALAQTAQLPGTGSKADERPLKRQRANESEARGALSVATSTPAFALRAVRLNGG